MIVQATKRSKMDQLLQAVEKKVAKFANTLFRHSDGSSQRESKLTSNPEAKSEPKIAHAPKLVEMAQKHDPADTADDEVVWEPRKKALRSPAPNLHSAPQPRSEAQKKVDEKAMKVLCLISWSFLTIDVGRDEGTGSTSGPTEGAAHPAPAGEGRPGNGCS
jgi:hypothetical protein